MKKYLLLLFLLFSININAQFDNVLNNGAMLDGGLGISMIDGNPYYTFRFRPEIAIGNFGAGLDLNLEFDSNGNLRTENFLTTSDYLSIIRYLRWGQKHDPVYARVGALDYATLGYGNIMYLYNNSPSYDARTIGLVFDVDMDTWGVETGYANLAKAGVLGIRSYVRPLKFTTLGKIPVIGGMTVGLSYVTDVDKRAGYIDGYLDDSTKTFIPTDNRGNIQIASADLGFPIFQTSVTSLELYYTYTKILDFGSGSAVGALFNFDFTGVSLRVKFERTWNGKRYIPSYFDALYEIDRFNYDDQSKIVNSKVRVLDNATMDDANGWYGGLMLDVMSLFRVQGSYQRLDKRPNTGRLHLAGEVDPMGMPFVVRAGYDKTNIASEAELFTLDERSLIYAEVGYKPWPFMIVSLVYQWTFTPIRGAENVILGYERQEKIEPRVSFVMPLQF
ncbi:MAG: hypothetical protein GXO85_11895 [Chlorobi bacterium]|nr:hypothetical protein [Chlorobiota bacterium]